jgi:hypothetical protein
MNPDDQADDRTRAALHAVADMPAPPAVTTVEQVIQRGRRRALVQRGATVAAVVGVVAAIGVGGVLLRSTAEGKGVEPASPPATTTTAPTTTNTTTVPTESAPESTTTQLPPSSASVEPVLLDGWEWVSAPMTENNGYCNPAIPPDGEPKIGLPDRAVVRQQLLAAVRVQAGTDPVLVYDSWEDYSPKTSAPRGFFDVNVEMGDGPGSVQLEVGRFGGTPKDAADADVSVYGSCEQPSRRTLSDGTVLQLYRPDFHDPEIPMQHLGIYEPNGRHYVVTTAGYGEADKTKLDNGTYTVTSGRGRLPLADEGIAEVAESLAALE